MPTAAERVRSGAREASDQLRRLLNSGAICKNLQANPARDVLSFSIYSFNRIFRSVYILTLWRGDVEYTDVFEVWWDGLAEDEQDSVAFGVRLLEERGVTLAIRTARRSSNRGTVGCANFASSHQGRPYRVLYAFNPRRTAILLIGGDKTGRERWYDEHVPKADALYDAHLAVLEAEGLLPPDKTLKRCKGC